MRFLSGALRALTIIAIALAPAHAAYDQSPINAKKFFPASGFPQAEQRRLAHRLLGKGWQHDTEAETYLKRISRQLAPADEHFIIVADTDDVNAFAYLGGMMVVYRGLWRFAEEEDGFVSVIAHELGHIKLDHVRLTRENAEQASTIATPILIAGLLIDDPEVREAVVAGSAGLLTGDIIAYSRELEHEADIFGLDAMIKSMWDANAMARIFANLGGGGNEYLSTHPAPARRGAYLANRLHDYTPPPSAPQLDFYLLREKFARHEVVERQYQQSRRAQLAADGVSERDRILAHYGLLLSATKTRNKKLGEEMVAALAGQTHPFIVRALAENLRQRGQHAEALALISRDRDTYLQHPALVLELFSIYERLKQHNKALALYKQLPAELHNRHDILLAAGRAASFAKKRVLSNYYLGYGYALDGRFEQSLKQIAIAEKFKGGDVNLVIQLEQLKKQVNRELRLLKEKLISEEG